MFAITMKGLWAHKRRLLSTFFAVCLGISFLSGTMVLGDTMRSTFATIFENANAGLDVEVAAERLETEMTTQQERLDPAVLDAVRGVEGVDRAEPVITGFGRIIGADGKPVGGMGPPTIAGNWVDDPDLNPYRLAEGRLPTAPDEVIVNRSALTTGQLAIGDRITLQTPENVEATVVGASTFGELDSSAGVTFTAFTLEGARQHLLGGSDELSSIAVAAKVGVTQDELAARIQQVLPPRVEAVTGAELTAEATASINADFLDFFTTFLMIFAAIALVVASFSIYNTFSIIVAQRGRESALLRALGASRGQVLRSTIAEAAIVGVVASVVGLAGGVLVATLLKGAFAALGMDLPATGLALSGSTVAWSLAVGVLVTLFAGIVPALRASRIPPIAALRDLAIDRSSASVVRLVAGLLVTAAGVGLVVFAVTAEDGVLAAAGLGSFLTIAGVVALGPVVAGRAARVLGWPAARLRGVSGSLARENAARNPRRTSGTASALMIGVGVVSLFTVVAASLTASVSDSVGRSFGGDLVVSGGDTFGGTFSPELAREIANLDVVATSAGLGAGAAVIDGATESFPVVDLVAVDQVLDLDIVEGSAAGVAGDSLAISRTEATDRGWTLGEAVPITFVDGTVADFTVGAIYADSDVMGDLMMSRDGWTPRATESFDMNVLIGLQDGVSLADGRAAVEGVAASYAGTVVQDRDQYVDSVAAGVNQMLTLVYVMLALAILIALMGIANTLSLSIHERTRELGLLRAVGQTRRQIRSMVRWEAVVMALFGTVGGIGVGVFLGWALVRAASGEGIGVFSAAPGQLAVVAVIGAIAGVLAAIRPARSAARLDVLTAIATT
jgi:putative ABC transport system permease protein